MVGKVCWFDTGALSPYENMAVDEALFLRGLPTIRFYHWNETACSIGYFQSAKEYDFPYPLVRRITGGGTVVHGSDLTYSIVCGLTAFPSLDSIKQSYFWIHQGILEALRNLKIPVEIFSAEKHESLFEARLDPYGVNEQPVSSHPRAFRRPLGFGYEPINSEKRSGLGTGAPDGALAKERIHGRQSMELQNSKFCFQSPCSGDLVLEKRKVAGGAQRRRGGLLLHQGSIELAPLHVERRLLIKAVLEAFAHTFKFDLKEESDILSLIKDPIASLKQKYSSRAWTYKF